MHSSLLLYFVSNIVYSSAPMLSHRINTNTLSSSACPIYALRLRLPFGLHCLLPTYPFNTPCYRISVHLATISLLLILSHTSQCKSCKSLSSSCNYVMTNFHHRPLICPSYPRKKQLQQSNCFPKNYCQILYLQPNSSARAPV